MWLLWVLPKNRPQPGSMFVSRENQIWPHFPGNHLLKPPSHTVSDFFFFKLSLCFSFLFFTLSFFSFTRGITWLMQKVKLNLPISDLETTSKGKRELGERSWLMLNWKLVAAWASMCFLCSLTVSPWTGIYGMFSPFALLILWVSYGTDLLSMRYSNLADAQVAWLYLARHTPAQYLSKHLAFTHSFLVPLCLPPSMIPSSFPAASRPPILFSFLHPPPPQESKASKDQHKHTVRDRNNVSNEMRWQTDVCEQRWK